MLARLEASNINKVRNRAAHHTLQYYAIKYYVCSREVVDEQPQILHRHV